MDALKLSSRIELFVGNTPHWLIPRSGEVIVKCVSAFGENSCKLWRYWNDPSSPFIIPSMNIEINSSTEKFLARQWKDESFGFLFPEMVYLSNGFSEDLLVELSNCCQRYSTGFCPDQEAAASLKRLFAEERWLIFPLALAPFMEESITNHCLVIIPDTGLHKKVGASLKPFVNLLTWKGSCPDWPIASDIEAEARIRWENEL